MRAISKDEKLRFMKKHNLLDTFIDENILYSCRDVIPARIQIGRFLDTEEKIFFEECVSSLKYRHLKKRNKVSGWNLLKSDGEKSELITKEEIEKRRIFFKNPENWDKEKLTNFLETKTSKFNIISNGEETRTYNIRLTEWQYQYVKKFVDKLKNLTDEQEKYIIKKLVKEKED